MPRQINISQLKSQLRQAEWKATSQFNNAVRKINSDVKRDLNRAVSNYNSAVRKHNSQVQHNRQIIKISS